MQQTKADSASDCPGLPVTVVGHDSNQNICVQTVPVTRVCSDLPGSESKLQAGSKANTMIVENIEESELPFQIRSSGFIQLGLPGTVGSVDVTFVRWELDSED